MHKNRHNKPNKQLQSKLATGSDKDSDKPSNISHSSNLNIFNVAIIILVAAAVYALRIPEVSIRLGTILIGMGIDINSFTLAFENRTMLEIILEIPDHEKHYSSELQTLFNKENDLSHEFRVKIFDKIKSRHVLRRLFPTYYAMSTDQYGLLSLLLSKDQNGSLIEKDFKGKTLLYLAVEESNYNAVKVLLEYNANVDAVYTKCIYKSSGKECTNTNPLLLSIRNGDDDIANLLINNKANVSFVDQETGRNLLHYSTLYNHSNLTRLILSPSVLSSSKLDINSKTKQGDTALHYASEYGNLEMVKLLIAAGADVKTDKFGWTPLHAAAENDRIQVCLLLLKHGANINATISWTDPDGNNVKGKCPLIVAYKSGHSELAYILSELGSDANCVNDDLASPLIVAAQQGHANVAESLIKHGANINYTVHDDIAAIHLATQKGHVDILKLLIDNHVDINAKLADQSSALHVACQYQHHNASKYLLENGIEVDSIQNKGYSPLLLAVAQKDIEMVRLLLSFKANTSITLSDGTSGVHYASQKADLEMIKLLVEQGHANVNGRMKRGWNVLHSAVFGGSEEVVEYLLVHGANPDAALDDTSQEIPSTDSKNQPKTIDGEDDESFGQVSWSLFSQWTPLHFAVNENNLNMVRLLLKYGANPDPKDTKKRGPLDLAKEGNFAEAIELLMEGLQKSIKTDIKMKK